MEIGNALQGEAGMAAKAEVPKRQYETTQELSKMQVTISGVMESVTTMTKTIEKKCDEMTQEKTKKTRIMKIMLM